MTEDIKVKLNKLSLFVVNFICFASISIKKEKKMKCNMNFSQLCDMT